MQCICNIMYMECRPSDAGRTARPAALLDVFYIYIYIYRERERYRYRYIYIYICMYMYEYTYTYIHMYIYICTCMSIHIHIHIHTYICRERERDPLYIPGEPIRRRAVPPRLCNYRSTVVSRRQLA